MHYHIGSANYYNQDQSGFTSSQYETIIMYNVFSCSTNNSSNNRGGIFYNTSLNSSSFNHYLVNNSQVTLTIQMVITSGTGINQGNNSIEYYDIDMTRNDMGTYGGPNSWDNFHNSANGKARIFNLDVPSEVWMGQTPNLKADAVHQ